jgi:hypothetical protein
MLMRALFAPDSERGETDLAFRARGAEVSRLEGFSDAVFGFAITLLVISSKAPDSTRELLALRHAVLPFIASFTVLFLLWRAQFDFFRRYGLEDRRTIRLTGVLLGIVLLAVYPVRFLFTAVLDAIPSALLAGNDSMKSVITLVDLPKVFLLYAIGFSGVCFVFSRLYRHAASQHAVIGLSALELFDTRAIERRCLTMTVSGLGISAWCLLLLVIGRGTPSRDSAWLLVYKLGLLVVLLPNVYHRFASRRLARERRQLVEGTPALTPPSTGGRSPRTPLFPGAADTTDYRDPETAR